MRPAQSKPVGLRAELKRRGSARLAQKIGASRHISPHASRCQSLPSGEPWPRLSTSREGGHEPKLSCPFPMHRRRLNSPQLRQQVSSQTELRRPLTRLITKTTNATTSSKWMRPPATWRLKPSSQRIRSTTKIVQSIFVLLCSSLKS